MLVPEASPQHQSFLGRWNLTGTGTDVDHVYWLEIKEEAGGQLSGLFLNRTSSPVQLASVKVENGELIFQLRARGDRPAPEFRAKVEGDKLIGHHTERDRTVNWVGVRPPKWLSASPSGQPRYGTPVALFDGASAASLDAFRPQHANRPLNWAVEEGVMTNAPPANNLVSKQTFQNFRLQAEYKVSPGSNGGIYLRGRYELQILDDHGKPVEKTGNMAVYGGPRRSSMPAGPQVSGNRSTQRSWAIASPRRSTNRRSTPTRKFRRSPAARSTRTSQPRPAPDPGRPQQGLVPQAHGDADQLESPHAPVARRHRRPDPPRHYRSFVRRVLHRLALAGRSATSRSS
jgi:hypothetical protein